MYVDQVHVFQSFPFLDAATTAFRSIAKFAASMREPPRPRPDAAAAPPAAAPTDVPEVSVSRSSTPTDIDKVASEMAHGNTKLVKGDGTEIDIRNSEDEIAEEASTVPAPNPASRPADTGLSATASTEATEIPSPKPSKPMLRRAFSSFSRGATPPTISTVDLMPPEGARTTGHSPVDRMLSGRGSSTMPRSRKSRRPTLSAQLTLSPAKPTTRLRSSSHADMIQLMATYSAGAANQTTVYTPAAEQTFDFTQASASADADAESDGLHLSFGDRT
jgi:hypothetical protein